MIQSLVHIDRVIAEMIQKVNNKNVHKFLERKKEQIKKTKKKAYLCMKRCPTYKKCNYNSGCGNKNEQHFNRCE